MLDTCSGSVHAVDEVAYDIIEMYKTSTEEEIVEAAKGTTVTFDNEKGFQIIFYDGFNKELLEKQNRLQNFEQWVCDQYGKEFHFTLIHKEDNAPLPNVIPRGNRIDGIDMDIGEEF